MFNKQQIYNALKCQHSPLLAQSSPQLSNSDYTQRQLADFKSKSEIYLKEGIPPLTYNDFSQYFITGDRNMFQTPYYTRRGHLLVFSLLAKETGEARYINALNESIWALCNELTWCLPAHMLDHSDKDILPQQYATHIDLFASETAFALTEALALCEAYVPQQLAAIAKENIINRIIKPFEQGDVFYRFEHMTNNWSAVCAGAIGGVAMYLVNDNVRLSSILHRCLSSINVYLSSFGNDGVCTEGVDYWNYGFGFFVSFAQLLHTRTNGALDLFALPKVQAIARSGADFYLGNTATISFSDGSETGAYRMGLMCFLSQKYEHFLLPYPQAAANTLQDNCFRYCTAIRDMYWTLLQPPYMVGTSGNTWLADAQWHIARDGQCCMVAKAGHNNENHNHNDCGSFIFVKNGEQIICDLGAGLYDKAYFSDTRYDILVNRSSSHNIALINNGEQLFGREYECRDVKITENGLVCELSACYNIDSLEGYVRSISMTNKQISLIDSFAFSQNGDICEVFCGKEPIVISENTAVFTRNGESAQLQFDSNLFDAKVSSQEYPSLKQGNQTAYFLHLTNKASSKAIEFKANIK